MKKQAQKPFLTLKDLERNEIRILGFKKTNKNHIFFRCNKNDEPIFKKFINLDKLTL